VWRRQPDQHLQRPAVLQQVERLDADIVLGRLVLCVDPRILDEVEEVLRRPEFGLPAADIEALIEFIRHEGEPVVARPLKARLPDADDLAFVEVAVGARADALVTWIVRHDPPAACRPVPVPTPAALMRRIRQARS
jgi:predicted nucleic acid-binding protein